MKQSNPPTDNELKIGDRVRLVSETPLRKGEMDLQGQIGEVVECPEVKRVTFASPVEDCLWEGTPSYSSACRAGAEGGREGNK